MDIKKKCRGEWKPSFRKEFRTFSNPLYGTKPDEPEFHKWPILVETGIDVCTVCEKPECTDPNWKPIRFE